MAEGRMLNRSIARDEQVPQLSDRAALLFVLAIPHLDVEGRLDGLPATVRGTVVPYIARARPADWTDELVESYMVEWTRTLPRPLAVWYTVRGVNTVWFPGFEKNQKLRRDREAQSRLPEPPMELLEMFGLLDAAPRVGVGAVPLPDAVPAPDADSGPVFSLHPGQLRIGSGATPEELPPEAKAEVEVQAEDESYPSRQSGTVAPARDVVALADNDHDNTGLAALGAKIEARLSARAARPGTVERLLEVLGDIPESSVRTLRAHYAQLTASQIEHARTEILERQPRNPAGYAIGIAKRRIEAIEASSEASR